jgi:acetolactate synthase-1/3 small subunit
MNSTPANRNVMAKKSVYGAAPETTPEAAHTLSILVDNTPGVLAKIVGLFSGRGYNIESLTVAETDHDQNLSRITIIAKGTQRIIDQIISQLDKQVPVHNVIDLTILGPHVARELALIKVSGQGEKRVEAMRTAEIFRAKVVDTTIDSLTFEATGTPEKIDALVEMMQPLGLSQISRTGIAALPRGNGKI